MNFYHNRSNDPYFSDRFSTPYRSTIALEAFARKNGFFRDDDDLSLIADVACGTGSETAFLGFTHQNRRFIGLDLEEHFIDVALDRYQDFPNLSFFQADLFEIADFDYWPRVKSVWLSQTLSWLPWWKEPLEAILTANVERIVFSTLAWHGPNESEVLHFLSGRKSQAQRDMVNYNVYSIPTICEFMRGKGFKQQEVEEFVIDKDLESHDVEALGSYTVLDSRDKRMLFSMWQYLPFHFFYFARG